MWKKPPHKQKSKHREKEEGEKKSVKYKVQACNSTQRHKLNTVCLICEGED